MTGWRVTRLHHVAVADGDDHTGEALFASLLGDPVHSEQGDGFTERMYAAGGPFLQTLEATGDGVVRRFLDKQGPGLHHIALAVDRLGAALPRPPQSGGSLVGRTPPPGGGGARHAVPAPPAGRGR